MYFKEDTEKSIFFFEKKQQNYLQFKNQLYLCSRNQKRDVAQLASAPRSGRGGRKFESSHPDSSKRQES